MKHFILGYLSALLSVAALPLGFAAYLWTTTPSASNIRSCLQTVLYKVRLCPTDPSYVQLKDVSPAVTNAIIASEDGSFYNHKGFDLVELQESYFKNMKTGTYARGGSTITQQLAKNVYLTAEKSMMRKVREALVAHQLESILSKDEILEKYLNVVEFGEGIYGIGPASQHYFKKHPSKLTVAEGAFLAFLLPSPKKYSVSFYKKQLTPFARGEMRKIVMRVASYGKIAPEQKDSALSEIDHFFGASTVANHPSSDEFDSFDLEESASESSDGSNGKSKNLEELEQELSAL